MRVPSIGPVQLAAMLAGLLLATGMVLRISTTLSPIAPETRTDIAAERAIQLRDGALQVTLFPDVALAPGESASRCITVSATGTRVPEEVRMVAASVLDERLGEWLRLDISRGPQIGNGRFCNGFVPTELVLSGTAAELVPVLDAGVPWVPAAGEEIPGGHATTYQLIATLLEDAPDSVQGASLAFDLAWESEFDAVARGALAQSFALAVRFTEDSMIPMLAILSLAILFLGIQDRLDTSTPRLARAALFEETVEFSEPGE